MFHESCSKTTWDENIRCYHQVAWETLGGDTQEEQRHGEQIWVLTGQVEVPTLSLSNTRRFCLLCCCSQGAWLISWGQPCAHKHRKCREGHRGHGLPSAVSHGQGAGERLGPAPLSPALWELMGQKASPHSWKVRRQILVFKMSEPAPKSSQAHTDLSERSNVKIFVQNKPPNCLFLLTHCP